MTENEGNEKIELTEEEIIAWIRLYEYVRGCVNIDDSSIDYSDFINSGREIFKIELK